MIRFALHGGVIPVLTVLTQLGGVAWLIACGFRRRARAFVLLYGAPDMAALLQDVATEMRFQGCRAAR